MVFNAFRTWIENVGREFVDFYIQNNLWINTIILGYALLFVSAHRNYYRALEKILIYLRFSNKKFSKEGITSLTLNDYRGIDWVAIRKTLRFPLASKPKSWRIKSVSPAYLNHEFSLEKLNSFIQTAQKKG